jgi:nitroimidazol reductase NimA-like FMN-containing flavoprotein (pyridoxamine 5'-phosphate oxidase superfamily)
MSLNELQSILDQSVLSATELTRALFGRSQWSAQQVQDFVNAVFTGTVATTGPTGRPHAAWVLIASIDGRFYSSVTNGSVLLRNLRHSPHIAFTVSDTCRTSLRPEGESDHGIMGQGKATLLGRADELKPLLHRLNDAVDRDHFVPDRFDGHIAEIAATRLFAS